MGTFEETVKQYIGTAHTRHAFLHDNCIIATLDDEAPQPEDSRPFCADAGQLIALIPFLLEGYHDLKEGYHNLSSLLDDAADKYILARQENYTLWRIGTLLNAFLLPTLQLTRWLSQVSKKNS